jgi:hypothetical protein
MDPNELSVLLPANDLETRLFRLERAVETVAECLGVETNQLVDHPEEVLDVNSIDRLERMLTDLSEGVRMISMWVREGERQGQFPPSQWLLARHRVELADAQSSLKQIDQALDKSDTVPEIREALVQRRLAIREQISDLSAKIFRLERARR